MVQRTDGNGVREQQINSFVFSFTYIEMALHSSALVAVDIRASQWYKPYVLVSGTPGSRVVID